ncbi:hypothetical protein IPH92_01265 [Candidatus Kaiserbacteria bacterium]|nr:MAG: hypothetical protein IPH92_01265 [Candidatus Kaiserbacteria bacterium]
MSEVEKQESQKTVVAFITGLLIGGLLVWVFSSTPEAKQVPEEKTTDTEQVEKADEEKSEEVKADSKEVTKDVTSTDTVVGKGALDVKDQAAGKVVTLSKVEFPTKNGWIVVRDYVDGTSGKVLGAARYSEAEGLTPTSVELMRGTIKDSSYQVVFFTNAGDAGFSLTEDKVIVGGEVTFKAN